MSDGGRPAGVRMRLYALRHGEPESTTMFYGHRDVRLSERGQRQARAQAQLLAGTRLDAVWSSDLFRARFGAQAIADVHAMEVGEDPRLREMHLGALEGVPYAEARQRFPALAGKRYEDMLDHRFEPGGESVRDVAERLDPAVDERLREVAARARDGRATVVVYAHNTVTRLLLARAAGLGPAGYVRFAQRYGAVNRIDLVVDAGGDGGAVRWDLATIAWANRDAEGATDAAGRSSLAPGPDRG